MPSITPASGLRWLAQHWLAPALWARRAPSPISVGALIALGACSSTGDEDLAPYQPPPRLGASTPATLPTGAADDVSSGPDAWTTTTDVDPGTAPTGFLLAELDRTMTAWNQAKLEAHDPPTATVEHNLRDYLRYLTRLRREDLIEELSTGPPRNRTIAAMALGFTGDVEAEGPLLASLSDRDGAIVANALLGLGLLGRADTPLEEICRLLQHSPRPEVRNSAAYAMQCIVTAGGRSDAVAVAARRGLVDAQPGVRVPSALTLGLIVDTNSVERLSDLLYDEIPLVSNAAASSLVLIGTRSLEHKGVCARLLFSGLDRVTPSRRSTLLQGLARLSGRYLGEETEAWRDWVRSLP